MPGRFPTIIVSDMLQPGKTCTLVSTFTKKPKYSYLRTVPAQQA
jgi:hypothetical protein